MDAPPRSINDGLAPDVIATFSLPSGNIAPIRMGEVKTVGSYNWVEDKTPTILIPGLSIDSL
jgi:hypothetical protein